MTPEQAREHAAGLIDRNPTIISKALESGATPLEALKLAVEHEQRILIELIENKTERAKRMRAEILKRTAASLGLDLDE